MVPSHPELLGELDLLVGKLGEKIGLGTLVFLVEIISH